MASTMDVGLVTTIPPTRYHERARDVVRDRRGSGRFRELLISLIVRDSSIHAYVIGTFAWLSASRLDHNELLRLLYANGRVNGLVVPVYPSTYRLTEHMRA